MLGRARARTDVALSRRTRSERLCERLTAQSSAAGPPVRCGAIIERYWIAGGSAGHRPRIGVGIHSNREIEALAPRNVARPSLRLGDVPSQTGSELKDILFTRNGTGGLGRHVGSGVMGIVPHCEP